MLRAVRYEGRLSFRLEEETERLLRRDLAYLDAISGARLWAEIVAMFYEEQAAGVAGALQELGILTSIHPCLRFDETGEAALARAQEERPAPWDEVCLCLLCLRCREEDVGLAGAAAGAAPAIRARAERLRPIARAAAVAGHRRRVAERADGDAGAVHAASVWALALSTRGRGRRGES